MNHKCPECGVEVIGRLDKIYCGRPCKIRAMRRIRGSKLANNKGLDPISTQVSPSH